MPLWHRGIVAGVVVLVAVVVAHFVDRLMTRRTLEPDVVTRYRVFRRGIEASIVVVGVLSALLVIPQVRAVAAACSPRRRR